ncbi:hypothetical protein JKI95_09920 [Corynebacterium aquatimens]|uniref:hypothetical protein n=1 Tax=Corynebacterium aquatimens TaxID=1190508 RepID=UPI0025403273|nr:hypothetical protein [Corynebacterium aquatimens]QYH19403.1 hypothetical protein JKI95_09920 [Corynebacterium aquatimens]
MRFSPAKTAGTAAALIASAGLIFAAPSLAQPRNMETLMKVASQADSISCSDLQTQLKNTGRVNANTTRGDLIAMANAELAKESPMVRSMAAPTVNKVADRAVSCGIVKANNASAPAPAQQAQPKQQAPAKAPANNPAKPAPAPAPANKPAPAPANNPAPIQAPQIQVPQLPALPGGIQVDKVVEDVNRAIADATAQVNQLSSNPQAQIDALRAQVNAILPTGSSF